MNKFELHVRQTITYDHVITVQCENEEQLDAEIVVSGVTEDGSGDVEFEYDYDEA